MLERLYCPDFSAVFGEPFRNPFDYPFVDCLVWPLFVNGEFPPEVAALLDLNREGHPLFYRRNITLGDFAIEQQSGNVGISLLQGMEIGRDYGIPNQFVQEIVSKAPQVFSAVYSVNLAGDGFPSDLADLSYTAGIVVYPTLCNVNLTEPNDVLRQTIDFCQENNLPLKIDLGNNYLPENNRRCADSRLLDTFAANNPDLNVIFSGPDPASSEIQDIFNILKYRRNMAVEIDPRSIGGMTPKQVFTRLFAEPGVIQNCWGRILLGSATPTLELSQMVRGLWESTESLPLSSQHLLRIWGFRNAHRWYKLPAPQTPYTGILERPKSYSISSMVESERELGAGHSDLSVIYEITAESFAITQLLWLQPALEEAVWDLQERYPEFKNGELQVRTKHTTTSLLMNEHEVGNFLELHYKFVEETRADPSQKLHTVAAEENRADFNFPDHLVATTYGQREVTIPYNDGKMLIGGRENLYLLATFGPRSMHVNIIAQLKK